MNLFLQLLFLFFFSFQEEEEEEREQDKEEERSTTQRPSLTPLSSVLPCRVNAIIAGRNVSGSRSMKRIGLGGKLDRRRYHCHRRSRPVVRGPPCIYVFNLHTHKTYIYIYIYYFFTVSLLGPLNEEGQVHVTHYWDARADIYSILMEYSMDNIFPDLSYSLFPY